MEHNINNKDAWERYCTHELAEILPILEELGFVADKEQPHLGGERYLMQAVTTESGKKLILLGREKDGNKRVVIKVASDPHGVRELLHEQVCRETLAKMNFAYDVFLSPRMMIFTKRGRFSIAIQEFIANDRPFIERPLPEQFSFALKALKAQEGARATTYEHRRLIKRTFGEKTASDYVRTFANFKTHISQELPKEKELHAILEEGALLLRAESEIIEQYSGFLTHTDFVPHNFRIADDHIYLLDHSSIRFGNKHEGWARFINFMALYDPELEHALVQYVRDNKTEEELHSLTLMRVYRLGELIYYYTNTLAKSSGDLLLLNRARINFWSEVLRATLRNERVSPEIIQGYTKMRDTLRDAKEKERQQGLH